VSGERIVGLSFEKFLRVPFATLICFLRVPGKRSE
jgi:hypothetical protein